MRKNSILRYPTYLTVCIELYLINIRNAREYSKRDDSFEYSSIREFLLEFLPRLFSLLDDEKGIDLTAHCGANCAPGESRHYKSSRTVKPADMLLKL